jgi:hypothetical protein
MKVTVVTTITTTIDITGQEEPTHDCVVGTEYPLPETLVKAAALSACRAAVNALDPEQDDTTTEEKNTDD